ncbi:MAG: hypothetical protein ACRD13_02835 [Terriglobales bacterium]
MEAVDRIDGGPRPLPEQLGQDERIVTDVGGDSVRAESPIEEVLPVIYQARVLEPEHSVIKPPAISPVGAHDGVEFCGGRG